MAPRADTAALNVQPRKRRHVYEVLARTPERLSVKELLGQIDMSESDLRESLRKLDEAGLVLRFKGTWKAVPLEPAQPESPEASEAH